MRVEISNFGATIVGLYVPDKNGTIENVVMGYDKLSDYYNNWHGIGCSVGPNANRIANATFSLDGKEYKTDCILGAISNSKGFAGFEFYDDFKLNDGKFEVIFIPNMSKIEMLKLLKTLAIDKKTIVDNPAIVVHKNISKIINVKIPTIKSDLTLFGPKILTAISKNLR
mgnify:CR=1 FL=1